MTASRDQILSGTNATELTVTTREEDVKKKCRDRVHHFAFDDTPVRADESFVPGVVSSTSEEDGPLPRIM